MSGSNNDYSCKLTIKDSKNSQKAYICSDNNKCTVNLTKGEKYQFIIHYNHGFLDYNVNIDKAIKQG